MKNGLEKADEVDEDEENGAANGNYSGATSVHEEAALYPVPPHEGGGGCASDAKPPSPEYRAGKWGRYLRAPDFYFEIMREFGAKFVPLGEIVDIRRGITSGCDAFFMPHDISAELLNVCPDPKEFKRRSNGADHKDVASGKIKIAKAGDGSVHPIEAKYLRPEVHSLMEIDRPVVRAAELERVVLMVDKPLKDLKETWVRRYLHYGATQPFASKKSKAVPVPKRSTCAGRVPWYNLTELVKPGFAFWPMAQQYRHIVPTNPEQLICNHNLFDLLSKEMKNRGKQRGGNPQLNANRFFQAVLWALCGHRMYSKN